MVTRPTFDVVFYPVAAGNFAEGDTVCLRVPRAMLPVLAGALEPFCFPDAYRGAVEDQVDSARQVETWLAELLTRHVCEPEAEQTAECPACGGLVILEDSMGQVVTKVEVKGGYLYVEYGPCCVEQFPLDAGIELGFKLPPEEYAIEIPEELTGWDNTACAKADALVNALAAMVDKLFDGIVAAQLPWQTYQSVQNIVPGVQLGSTDFWAAYSAALVVAAQGYVSENEDEEFYQTLRCVWSAIFGDEQNGVTPEQYSAARSALRSEASKQWTIVNFATAFQAMADVQAYIFSAIGDNDVEQITAFIAATGNEDCGCPGAVELPGGLFTRSYDFDFDYFNPNTNPSHNMALTGDNPGYDFRAIAVEWNGQNDPNGEVFFQNGGAGYNISDYQSPFSGVFVLHDGSDEAIGWANLYYPTATLYSANSLDLLNAGTAPISTVGNNVDVHTDGTITALYDPADAP